ncbi:MAG: hypothetical protein M3O70_04315, partial [Actinomycetota bacterium]|nr:hypothetical protein [Actinomycetota bacterium]
MRIRNHDAVLLVSLAGEIHVKSARTRGRFQRVFCRNLQRALDRLAPGSRWEAVGGGRFLLVPTDLSGAVEAATTTFGCQRVELARALAWNGGGHPRTPEQGGGPPRTPEQGGGPPRT